MSNSCDPMDCSPSGSSVHDISQARILEWVAITFSRGSPQPNPGIKLESSALQGDSLLSETLGKPHIYLLRGKKADQEATVRTGHGTTDWFQIEKGVHQGCMMSPCLFNLYAQYIIRNAGLDEAQAGIKIPGRSINNLRYADDTTLMEESEEELKSLLI